MAIILNGKRYFVIGKDSKGYFIRTVYANNSIPRCPSMCESTAIIASKFRPSSDNNVLNNCPKISWTSSGYTSTKCNYRAVSTNYFLACPMRKFGGQSDSILEEYLGAGYTGSGSIVSHENSTLQTAQFPYVYIPASAGFSKKNRMGSAVFANAYYLIWMNPSTAEVDSLESYNVYPLSSDNKWPTADNCNYQSDDGILQVRSTGISNGSYNLYLVNAEMKSANIGDSSTHGIAGTVPIPYFHKKTTSGTVYFASWTYESISMPSSYY